jgi:hypothetical protein
MALIAVGTVDSLHAAYLFVNYLGRGTLHMDEVTVVADVRTTLTERLAALAAVRRAGAAPPR